MFGLGMSEIILLAVLALIVIGPKELPDLARTIGRFLNELKRSTSDFTEDLREKARFDPESYRDSIPNPKKANFSQVEKNNSEGEQLEFGYEDKSQTSNVEKKDS